MRVAGHERDNVSRNTGVGSGTMTTTGGVDSSGGAGGAIYYFQVGQTDDMVTAIQLSWPDATSSFTASIETTNFPDNEVAIDAVASYFWATEPITITGASGAAAGTAMVHFGNIAARRMRLKITVAATTKLYLRTWGKQ